MEDYVKIILGENTDIQVVDELIKVLEWEWCVEWGNNNCVLVDEDDLSVIIENLEEKGISYEITDASKEDFICEDDE